MTIGTESEMMLALPLSDDELEMLKVLADAHDTSVAAEIRTAVDAYLQEVMNRPYLEGQITAKRERLNQMP